MALGAEYISNPIPELRAGKTGSPETITNGGTQASGGVTYALIQVANDTVTLNGIYARYTAAASDATKAGTVGDPLLINIKASLTLTLDEAAIVLNAAAHAALIVATYSNSGGTVLAVSYDTNGVVGNTYTLAASAGGTVSAATLTGGQNNVAVSLLTENTNISLTQATDQDLTLADGEEFQNKCILMIAKAGAGNAVLTPANLAGGTTITYDTDKDYSILKFMDGEWYQVAGTATVA